MCIGVVNLHRLNSNIFPIKESTADKESLLTFLFSAFALLILSICFTFAYQSEVLATTFPDPESRGVWVTGNYLQGGSTAIQNLVENVKGAHLNIIYIDVWYHGSTIYPSKVVSDAGGPLQNPVFAGTDPLRMLIDIAHQNGIEVFAWFEWGFWVGNSSDSSNPPGIIKSHPGWAMVQRDTTKHFIHDTYGYEWWVDPAVKTAANFIVDLHEECAEKYPDIDGIEMDRMRYPDNSLSYSDSSRIRFMKETGGPDPLSLPDDDPSWGAWRAEQVTNVMRMIYQSVKGINPTCVVTCAVWPPYGMQGVLQQWDVWAKNSYADVLEPMLYLPPSDFPNQMQLCSNLIPSGFKLNAGIGTDGYGAGPITNVITEIRYARSAHAGGEVLFYYGSLSQQDLSLLRDSVYHDVTLPSYDDLVVDNWMPGVFATEGTWTLVNGGYGSTYRTRGGYGPTYLLATATSGNRATYSFRVLRSGNYTLYGYWSGDSVSNCKSVVVNLSSSYVSMVDTVDQSKGLDNWNYIAESFLNAGDTVRVTVYGVGNGNVIADAFRLRKGIPLQLEDQAVPDSGHILLKFNQDLLNPIPSCTKFYFNDSTTTYQAFLDNNDNTVLHLIVPPMASGTIYMLHAVNVVTANYDTSSFTISIEYNPDSTLLELDDTTSSRFTTMGFPWVSVSDTSAVGGSCRIIKQRTTIVRAEWGPFEIYKDGYYDVYASIPNVGYPLSTKCVYIVLSHSGSDSVTTSQQDAINGRLFLGNFKYVAGDVGAVMILSGVDTTQYLVADAVLLRKSVSISPIRTQGITLARLFNLYQNYPNPFNPSTTIKVSLSHGGVMSLKIYNILGQLVKVVDDSYKSAGEYVYHVNMDKFGSGVYFYVLQQGNSVLSRRMLLLK